MFRVFRGPSSALRVFRDGSLDPAPIRDGSSPASSGSALRGLCDTGLEGRPAGKSSARPLREPPDAGPAGRREVNVAKARGASQWTRRSMVRFGCNHRRVGALARIIRHVHPKPQSLTLFDCLGSTDRVRGHYEPASVNRCGWGQREVQAGVRRAPYTASAGTGMGRWPSLPSSQVTPSRSIRISQQEIAVEARYNRRRYLERGGLSTPGPRP